MLEISLLGKLIIKIEGRSVLDALSPKGVALLVYLISNGQAQRREYLARR